ncbi:MAG: hypothetical protein K2M53_04635 [Muribaculaceae bacterium]|nr:hypothetical protein [Muribaculaceae bacterium]
MAEKTTLRENIQLIYSLPDKIEQLKQQGLSDSEIEEVTKEASDYVNKIIELNKRIDALYDK